MRNVFLNSSENYFLIRWKISYGSKNLSETVNTGQEKKMLHICSKDVTHLEKDATHFEKDATHLEKDATHLEKDVTHFEKDVTHLEKNATHLEKDVTHLEKDVTYLERFCREKFKRLFI